MPYVFEHLELVEEVLRQSPFGLITDVDGTISQTAPTPQQAVVSRLCRHYLSILSRHLALVAAISGRPVTQVKDIIGINGVVYIGSHGLEPWAEGRPQFTDEAEDSAKTIKAVIAQLSTLAGEGIWIEDKGASASVHYRLHPEPESARRAILAALQNLPEAKKLRIIEERKAIGLLPPRANKGTATLDLIQRYDLHGGIYLGDDATDIDAFAAVRTASRELGFHGLAIGIISQEMPENLVAEADFTLNGVEDVERFLGWMSQIIAPD